MLKKIAQQFKLKGKHFQSYNNATNPTEDMNVLKILSKRVINLYERSSDINKFTKLALSDSEDKSHEQIVENILKEENLPNDLFDNNLDELIENQKFIDDLGL